MFKFLFILFSVSVPFYLVKIEGYYSFPTILAVLSLPFIIYNIVKINSAKKNIIITTLGLFFIILFYSTFSSPVRFVSLEENLLPTILRFIFFIIPFVYIKKEEDFFLAIKLIMIISIIVSSSIIVEGIGIYTFSHSRAEDSRIGLSVVRTIGVINNYADFTIISLSSIILLVFFRASLYKNTRLRNAVIYSFMATLILLSEFIAQSRNFLIVLFFILILYALKKNYKIRYFLLFGSTLFILIMVLTNLSLIEEFYYDFFYLGGNTGGRIIQYIDAISMISKNIFLGFGLKSFQNVFNYNFEVHNIFIQIVFSGGLLALVVYLRFIYLNILELQRLPKLHLDYNYYFLTLVLLIILLSGSLFYPAVSSLIFWYMSGITMSIPFLNYEKRN